MPGERPILFSGAMVRAILAGAKTQTRRVVTVPWRGSKRALPYEPYYVDSDGELLFCDEYGDYHPITECMQPYGAPGDRLWVRETWASPERGVVGYQANGERGAWIGDGAGGRIWIHHGWIQGVAERGLDGKWWGPGSVGRWRPSIHMPRWASRISLEVTGVRVERLQEISEEDARAEGVAADDVGKVGVPAYSARQNFERLWDQINGERAPWASNPWIWVIAFRRVDAAARAALPPAPAGAKDQEGASRG